MLILIMMARMISDIKRLMRNAKNKGLNKELLFFTQLKIFIRSIVKTFWQKSFAGRVKLQKQLLSCLLQDRFCQKIFFKFTGNTCARISFLIKIKGSTLFKKETLTQVLSCKFCKILKNSFIIEPLGWLLLLYYFHFSHMKVSVIRVTVM